MEEGSVTIYCAKFVRIIQCSQIWGVFVSTHSSSCTKSRNSKQWAATNQEVCTSRYAVLEGDDVRGFEHEHLKEAARSEGLGGCRWHNLSEKNCLFLARVFLGKLVDHCSKKVKKEKRSWCVQLSAYEEQAG
jgi:hypothetical protein